ncbi:hypothetical protein D9757_014249 [Collybiopsis confluens]|uniref:G domain-containing protein n=1 Tax=Collybiopsis confluens TaxID=2823264 RepID=A0A8H5G5Z5_9AGAR|nr:hypothetical protein D9757_014249 [Collybiopsis confluens]
MSHEKYTSRPVKQVPTGCSPRKTKVENGKPPERNILLFGDAGSGKSSIVNMLLSEPRAVVSSRAVNLALFSAALTKGGRSRCRKPGRLFKLFSAILATRVLRGYNLLVLCIRAPRITDVVANNYKLFYWQTVCKRQVPIVTIITGLENNRPTMEDWWSENRAAFTPYRMKFQDHVCITATKGRRLADAKGFVYEKEYNDSVKAVQKLVVENTSILDEGWEYDARQFNMLWGEIFNFYKRISSPVGKKIQSVTADGKAKASKAWKAGDSSNNSAKSLSKKEHGGAATKTEKKKQDKVARATALVADGTHGSGRRRFFCI